MEILCFIRDLLYLIREILQISLLVLTFCRSSRNGMNPASSPKSAGARATGRERTFLVHTLCPGHSARRFCLGHPVLLLRQPWTGMRKHGNVSRVMWLGGSRVRFKPESVFNPQSLPPAVMNLYCALLMPGTSQAHQAHCLLSPQPTVWSTGTS